MNELEVNDYLDLLPKLSKREIQILAMTCVGLNRNEIAINLNISVRTVDTHLTHATQKYELDNRSQLQAIFFFNFLRKLKTRIN